MAIPSSVYLFTHVQHGTQSIQHDCHQWFSDSFRVHQIRCRPGPRTPLGELTVLSRSPSWFKGPTSKDMGKDREGKGREKSLRKGMTGEGRGDRLPLRTFSDLPLLARTTYRACKIGCCNFDRNLTQFIDGSYAFRKCAMCDYQYCPLVCFVVNKFRFSSSLDLIVFTCTFQAVSRPGLRIAEL